MRVVAAATRNLGQVDESLSTYEALLAVTRREANPLDWAQEQHALGELLTDLGYWYHEADVDLLGRAAEAYGEAAAAAARYDAYAARYSRIRRANAQTHIALRSNDVKLLRRAAEDGATALAEYGHPNNTQWGLSALTIGQNQVLAGIALDDSKLVKAALANFAAADKVITPKNLAYDWAMSKLAEGDALRFLGLKSPRSTKQLKAAVTAYRDGIAVMEDIGNINPYVVFAHTKMVRLQKLIGAKIKPEDKALGAMPEPAVMEFDSATVVVQRGFAQEDQEQFAVKISNASANGEPWAFSFMVDSGYDGSSEPQHNLSYLQATFYSSQLSEPASKTADYSDCGSDEGSGGRITLFYGRRGVTNACVLSKMGQSDAAIWQTVLAELPTLVHKLGDGGNSDALRLYPLFAMMPLLQ
jgi:tetratricopeptide (TPR) repeat protein